jgi:hypothetical protein
LTPPKISRGFHETGQELCSVNKLSNGLTGSKFASNKRPLDTTTLSPVSFHPAHYTISSYMEDTNNRPILVDGSPKDHVSLAAVVPPRKTKTAPDDARPPYGGDSLPEYQLKSTTSHDRSAALSVRPLQDMKPKDADEGSGLSTTNDPPSESYDGSSSESTVKDDRQKTSQRSKRMGQNVKSSTSKPSEYDIPVRSSDLLNSYSRTQPGEDADMD